MLGFTQELTPDRMHMHEPPLIGCGNSSIEVFAGKYQGENGLLDHRAFDLFSISEVIFKGG